MMTLLLQRLTTVQDPYTTILALKRQTEHVGTENHEIQPHSEREHTLNLINGQLVNWMPYEPFFIEQIMSITVHYPNTFFLPSLGRSRRTTITSSETRVHSCPLQEPVVSPTHYYLLLSPEGKTKSLKLLGGLLCSCG